MRVVYADAGFWIGLLNPRDGLHGRAASAYSRINPAQLLTSEMVLAEVFNSLADKGPEIRAAVVQLEQSLRKRADVTIVPQTSVSFRDAAARYARRGDQEWGLTDCASFLIMEREGVHEALAYDHHFEQAGFQALLRIP